MGAWLPDGRVIEYVPDGLNRRVGKKVNGALTEGFLYDGQLRPVAWLNGAGQVYATFVYGLHTNVPEYMTTSAGTFRILTDHLGSPRLVVNTASGAVAQRMDYDAFGQVLADTNPGFQPFGFAGGLYDRDTGLVKFGARDYDPVTGRWTNKDPIRFRGGLNLYEYSSNDPVNRIDPTGLTWSESLGMFWDWLTGGGPQDRVFGPGSNQVNDMKNSPGVGRARDYYNQKNAGRFICSEDVAPLDPVTNYKAGFGLTGVWQAGLDSTQQYVGDYAVKITPNPDGSATYSLSNTTSMTSFTYGVGPSWDRSTLGPGGNMSQTYTWTE
jgi:RHS repeat-associated protein